MTYHVVELDPSPNCRTLIERIWHEIASANLDAKTYGAAHGQRVKPHASLVVGKGIDVRTLTDRVDRFVDVHSLVEIEISYTGFFQAPEGLIGFAGLCHTPQFRNFHQALWDNIGDLFVEPQLLYRPESIVPHISLAHSIAPAEAGRFMVQSTKLKLPVVDRPFGLSIVQYPEGNVLSAHPFSDNVVRGR